MPLRQAGRHLAVSVSFFVLLGGCAGSSTLAPSASPSAAASVPPTAAPTATPAGSELLRSPLPSETGVADVPSGTLTIIPGTQADGPGESVRSIIARAPVQMALVNGWLLIDVDGTVWLCEALTTSDPPRCDGARLRVEGYTEDELAHIRELSDIRESGGIHWLAQPTQRFGNVTTP